MANQEVLENASAPVGGGETGVSKAADPVATGDAHANRKADKKGSGEPMDKGQGEAVTPQGGNASAEANKASVAAKSTVKEEIAGLFGAEDLSEEFREKATVIFEAAVAGRIAEERARLQEEYDTNFATAKAELAEELTGHVNKYLDYVVEQWMEENQVAIESSLNAQIAEDFMQKLKDLFVESHIQIPEDKVDVVEELATRVEELEAALNAQIDENIGLKTAVDEQAKTQVFKEVSEGLALTQVEKFVALAEGVDFTDAESYRAKLDIVKAQYFTESKAPTTTMEENEIVELDEEVVHQPKVAPGVANYMSAISRTIKK